MTIGNLHRDFISGCAGLCGSRGTMPSPVRPKKPGASEAVPNQYAIRYEANEFLTVTFTTDTVTAACEDRTVLRATVKPSQDRLSLVLTSISGRP